MDCFYAAIEIRDDPSLAELPVAVGGAVEQRGVLCTCNYVARKHGVRSAMATAYAKRLCPNLVVLPVNMKKYREVAKAIQQIFYEYTPLVEPLSLDEAYLDVSGVEHCQGSATWMAQAIRKKIFEQLGLTASAGVAPNKFLAKIASGWKKPNGLFVIRPQDVENFLWNLPVDELFGVGKVTSKKLHALGLKTCADLQVPSLEELTTYFGKMGMHLFQQCRGIDNRKVDPNRIRKSLSVETTFMTDIVLNEDSLQVIDELYENLMHRLQEHASSYAVKGQFIKLKFSDFKQTTHQQISNDADVNTFKNLLRALIKKKAGASIRLMGIGVSFKSKD
jgi:DNA polymerase-4